MNNEYYLNFLDSSEQSIKNRGESNVIPPIKNNRLSQFIDNKNLSQSMACSLRRSLDNLDKELNVFENKFLNKYNSVFWALDYNDVFDTLKKIIKSHKGKSVRLPNINVSTIFRELGIKYFLRDEKIELSEDGDIQFFVADMLLPDTGSLLLLNQSNKIFEKLFNNKVNVFFTTIDRVLSNTAYSEYYQLMCEGNNSAPQHEMIIFKGSPNCSNYLLIIDNQRSSLLKEKSLRQSLSCTHCMKCNDVCPIMLTIGEEPYNNVFTGPIANITLPFLETIESYKHLVSACTLCGRCEEVCPVAMPIRQMILDERNLLFTEGLFEKNHYKQLSKLRKFLTSRKKMNRPPFLKHLSLKSILSSDIKKSRVLLPFCKDSFNKSFQKNN